ncbi:MAG: hypothetical protein HYY50_01360 [Candidatus Kerfeldbacteria bacterium]|nr:hypothetical protein [Candidatus Kerfeldbacteria bacterium]
MNVQHPNPRRFPTSRFLAALLAFLTVVVVFRTFQPRPAEAILGVGDVSVTVGDIPRIIFQFVDAARKRVGAILKVAGDIAFKNTLEIYNAKIAQEILTQISTAGPGQKPLFLTNPKTFFRDVANSAAGDFIDEFTRGLTGERGPGTAFSSARQRFIISRILRIGVGSPVEQCRDSCRSTYSVGNIDLAGVKEYSDEEFRQLTQASFRNEFEWRIVNVQRRIDTVTKPAIDHQESEIVCRDVALPAGPPLPGQNYLPWQIQLGACGEAVPPPECTTAPQECLNRQQEAINTERASAQQLTNQCLRDCQSGLAGLASDAINQATATDIFNATIELDTRQATRAITQELSRDNSDIGKTLYSFAQLYDTVQEQITAAKTELEAGAKPRTSKVSEVVLVPKEANQQSLFTALVGGDDAKKIYTGTTAADIIKGVAAFINSPLFKVLTLYFKHQCGLNTEACRGPSQPTSTLGQLLFGSGGPTGLAGARLQFSTVGQTKFLTGDPGRNEVDIPNELASAGLIDAQFRNAIEDRLTVQEALDKGTLDPRKTFGFDRNGVQPRDGYPFRALQYLRKYRVVPVGWELAANFSLQFDPRDLSFGFLTKQFNLCGQDETHRVCTNDPNTSCQADDDCSGNRCGASPYCGLVDPNWVLKAPQTYCRRQGAGEEIITKEFVCDENNIRSIDGVVINPAFQDAGPDGIPTTPDDQDNNPPNCVKDELRNVHPDLGRWVVSRNTNTCADTQSCIAENDDGTCIAFGYCVQERQQFRFDGTQCDAEFASCTTYTDDQGQPASYLASTLDFRNCNADVAGCQWYCQNYDAEAQRWTCGEPPGNDDPSVVNDIIRFTSNVQACNQSQAGCRQFVRTSNGSNLLPNGGFEIFSGAELDSGLVANYDSWNKIGGIGTFPVSASDPDVTSSNRAAIKLTGGAGDELSATIDTGYALYERSFSASIRARADSSCTASLEMDTDVVSSGQVVTIGPSWATQALSIVIPEEERVRSFSNALTFTIKVEGCGGANLVVDSAQLEESGLTQFKDYGQINAVYLNGTRRSCTTADVGCESYTPLAGGSAITAQVRNSNRCTEDKVGCATYTLEPLPGPIPRPGGSVNIIAPKGQSCSASNVGCEEYTNLDEVARGGEGKEYYQSVKQCVRPKSGDPSQATYYTWVGDAARGFILRSHTLLKSNIDASPCTHPTVGAPRDEPVCDDAGRVDTSAICNADTLSSNPDCAEFYDSSFSVYYRLRSLTVSVTDDCHPYRNSVDQTDADPGNDDNIYFLAPKENVACPATAAGCRAYTGNAGRSTRTIFSDTYESGTTANWVGGLPVTESTSLGGHSMHIPLPGGAPRAAAYTDTDVLPGKLADGKNYVVTFWAAAANSASHLATIKASFGSVTGRSYNEDQIFGSGQLRWNESITPAGPEWQRYTLGPLQLIGNTARLGITVTGGEAYVDNVTLTEINDSLYLVSSTVPLCEAADVGCAAYRDRAGARHYLKSFTRLCAEQVVGCEAMVDTQNSSTPFAQVVKNELTPEDAVVTAVNNRAAYCPAATKGCQALGKPTYTNDRVITGYQTVYLKNDPDQHARDLCLNEELFCRAYTTASGSAAFFKDPAHQTCEFRSNASDVGGQWYVSGTNIFCPTITPPLSGRPLGPSCSPTCETTPDSLRAGKACVRDVDCPKDGGGNVRCLGDASKVGKIKDSGGNFVFGQCASDTDCDPVTGNKCRYLAGLCPDEQNGCNEYRDPTDPAGCRSECPLIQVGGSPLYVDATCATTRCSYQCLGGTCEGGPDDGLACGSDAECNVHSGNCQASEQCGPGGQCLGSNGLTTTGIPGCRPYYYLRQTVETNAVDCNGQVNLETRCRPFNDTSKPILNVRGG